MIQGKGKVEVVEVSSHLEYLCEQLALRGVGTSQQALDLALTAAVSMDMSPEAWASALLRVMEAFSPTKASDLVAEVPQESVALNRAQRRQKKRRPRRR